jgi:SAM-dependent methyltransferase
VLEEHGARRGRLYDASCGEGRSSNLLAEMGYEVVCSTLAGRPNVGPGVHWTEGVDLNCRLPFDDALFDVAVLQEVIEHLENPAHVIREFNRVLRPGGLWVLTTPNAGCLRSRVHFMLSGFIMGRRRPANYGVPPGNYTNLFIPFFPTLHYLLWSYGFRVVRTGHSERKLSSWLGLLLYPLVGPWTSRYARPARKYRAAVQPEACRDLRRLMLTPHFLLDDNLVLLLEKRHGIDGLYDPLRAPAGKS